MKLYIFTEGGKNIGFGHLARCISIYQAAETFKLDPLLITYPNHAVENLLSGLNYKIVNWTKEPDKFIKIIENKIIFIDSYLAPKEIYNLFSEKSKISAYFDDYLRINYPKGVIINAANNAEELSYPQKNMYQYLLGSSYIPLRKCFWKVPKKTTNKLISNILITLGGSVKMELLINILKKIDLFFPEVTKNVILGIDNKNEGKNYLGLNNCNFVFQPSLLRLKKLMLKSDIAISSGGQTLNELAICGLPTISICLDKNQRINIEGWLQKQFIEYAGNIYSKDLYTNIVNKIIYLQDKDVRILKSENGQKSVDGRGALRIINNIIKWS
ncbi:MAG: UDP-2,4-diacetamido-2,4,6-trideoxy-beta-L-altropyranose hydrolase [Bacteroidales bacterium]|nr:UDP-2,4-diacetamido-2,4,6-trideoxy-beta-L-altropyranose hydrolase [Bacteroidales bacterium]